jgi:hypothetical protein
MLQICLLLERSGCSFLLQICHHIHIDVTHIDLPQQFIAALRMNACGLQPFPDSFAQRARQPF